MQLHIQVRENGKYCREDAIKLMEDLKELNLAVLSTTSGRGCPTTIVHKCKLEDLSEEEKDLMFNPLGAAIILRHHLLTATAVA